MARHRIFRKNEIEKPLDEAIHFLVSYLTCYMEVRELGFAVIHIYFERKFVVEVWIGSMRSSYAETFSGQVKEYLEENLDELLPEPEGGAFYEILLDPRTKCVGWVFQITQAALQYGAVLPIGEVEPGALIVQALEDFSAAEDEIGDELDKITDKSSPRCKCQGPLHEKGCPEERCPICHCPIMGGCGHAIDTKPPKGWSLFVEFWFPPDDQRERIPERAGEEIS